jgi:glucans biosynthesis protein
LNRRHFLQAAASLPLVAPTASGLIAPARADATPFDRSVVRQLARDAASKPYKAPDTKLPDNLKNLDYDHYRQIRFLPERALWRSEKLPFQVQFFHRGLFYEPRVDIYEVVNGQATKIAYRADDFSFGDNPAPPPDSDLGFAGFRIHAPINRPDYYDEVCVFLGASYFRAVAKGETYGLSARGLAINTGESKGEEFPLFKTFWIEKPATNATSVVVHALLDSPSTTAAYRFTIRPGDTTVFDVEMAIYPRVDLDHAGLVPMTSMFFFGSNDRTNVDDFRPSVHDSDGLAIYNGRGEELWRPLSNPRDLQISSFSDLNPRGYGLMQRQKNFYSYEDLESKFETRPSLWAEPIGDWGEGAVQLVEIPTKEEIHDNIASFWRPKTP